MPTGNDAATQSETKTLDEETVWTKRAKAAMWAAAVVIVLSVSLAIFDGVVAPSVARATSQPAWQVRGTMGDFYGGHLAAGAGLAGFLLMFGAIVLQREELRLQRKDLRLNFQEYKRSIDETERQTKAIAQQNTELAEHTEAVNRQNELAAERNDTDYVAGVVTEAIDMYRAWQTTKMTASPDLMEYRRFLRAACEHKLRIGAKYIVRREQIQGRKLGELRDILFALHGMMGLDLEPIYLHFETGGDG